MDQPNRWRSRAATSARAGAAVCVAILAGCATGVGDDDGESAQAVTRAGAVSGARLVAPVAAGFEHSCAIAANGAVWCWGSNAAGQLGTNSLASTTSPVPAGTLTGAVAVTVGLRHSCALRGDGAVFCWGDNTSGQLGDGTGTRRLTPTPVAGITGATALVAGQYHTCALRGDGAVFCWGYNGAGAVGTGTIGGQALAPTAVTGFASGTRAVALAAGAAHTCALLSFGHVRCWGANDRGQLGDGTTTPTATPVAVAGSFAARALTAGNTHSCAALVDGTVRCWGDNEFGQLGTRSTAPTTLVVQPAGITDVVDVAAGSRHTCARDVRSVVRCWGDNRDGQLGDGGAGVALSPVTVAGRFRAIEGGAMHSCAVTDAGAVQCVGRGYEGQLGRGTATSASTYATVATMGAARGGAAITTGDGFTCARRANNQTWCWGRNDRSQSGRGPSAGIMAPAAVPIGDLEGVTTGAAFGCGLRYGEVYCWGDNTQSQAMQLPFTFVVDTPERLPVDRTTSVAAGANHTCAVSASGTVRCWGRNAYGQLGGGSTSTFPMPSAVTVPDLDNIVAVAGGGEHTCALQGTGYAWCWGKNNQGQTGRPYAAPVVVVPSMVSLANITAITAGEAHTCALRADGSVYCWGQNDRGQLGAGVTSETGTSTPLRVANIGPAVAIDAGATHTCALLTDGTVWCWGRNDARQLGRSEPAEYDPTAKPAASLGSVVALSAGTAHTCAVRADESVWCWGSNASGELGVTGGTSATPVRVPALP